jgi:hypothetical protein
MKRMKTIRRKLMSRKVEKPKERSGEKITVLS